MKMLLKSSSEDLTMSGLFDQLSESIERARDGADAAEFLDFRDGLMPYPGVLNIPNGLYFEIDTTSLTPKDAVQEVVDKLEGTNLILRDR